MSSLLNVSLPVLMQVNRSEGGTLLPWPNGSLLSGKLIPASDGAGAMLMLANYRVRVEVPPNTPMGKIWLQVLQREKPGQFRVLTDKQAMSFIIKLLKQQDKPFMQQQQFADAIIKHDWSKLPSDIIPFLAEVHGERVLFMDERQHQPRGFVQEEATKTGYTLYGRLDLEHFGSLLFVLSGATNQPMKIALHLQENTHQSILQTKFKRWLAQQVEQYPSLSGDFCLDMPQRFSSYTLFEV
jgi:hypothetical protein